MLSVLAGRITQPIALVVPTAEGVHGAEVLVPPAGRGERSSHCSSPPRRKMGKRRKMRRWRRTSGKNTTRPAGMRLAAAAGMTATPQHRLPPGVQEQQCKYVSLIYLTHNQLYHGWPVSTSTAILAATDAEICSYFVLLYYVQTHALFMKERSSNILSMAITCQIMLTRAQINIRADAKSRDNKPPQSEAYPNRNLTWKTHFSKLTFSTFNHDGNLVVPGMFLWLWEVVQTNKLIITFKPTAFRLSIRFLHLILGQSLRSSPGSHCIQASEMASSSAANPNPLGAHFAAQQANGAGVQALNVFAIISLHADGPKYTFSTLLISLKLYLLLPYCGLRCISEWHIWWITFNSLGSFCLSSATLQFLTITPLTKFTDLDSHMRGSSPDYLRILIPG